MNTTQSTHSLKTEAITNDKDLSLRGEAPQVHDANNEQDRSVPRRSHISLIVTCFMV
jgi:hypothetical protein